LIGHHTFKKTSKHVSSVLNKKILILAAVAIALFAGLIYFFITSNEGNLYCNEKTGMENCEGQKVKIAGTLKDSVITQERLLHPEQKYLLSQNGLFVVLPKGFPENPQVEQIACPGLVEIKGTLKTVKSECEAGVGKCPESGHWATICVILEEWKCK
jgi:hypothetical protein